MSTRVGLETLLSATEIHQRVEELGAEISRDYTGKDLVLVGVLHGALVFLADLLRAISLPVELDTVQFASYGDALTNLGSALLVKDLSRPIAGKHVLVVEDLVDTGLTLRALLDLLAAWGPASLNVCALLDKDTGEHKAVELAYLGFTVPDRWIVGYGIDAQHAYRNLPCIAMLPAPAEQGTLGLGPTSTTCGKLDSTSLPH